MSWVKLSYKELVVPEFFKEDTSNIFTEEIFPHQERLEKSFDLALKVSDEGYNVYVCGPRGVGRKRYTLKRLQAIKESLPQAPDICYVNNFEDVARPKCLLLPAGYGSRLAEGIEAMLDFLKRETFKAFEGKEYEEELNKVTRAVDAEKEKIFNALQEKAKKYNLMVLFSPQGIKLLPLFKIETPISEEDLFRDPRIREEYQKNLNAFEPIFREYMRKLREIDSSFGEVLIKLREKIAEDLVNKAFEQLNRDFEGLEGVQNFLKVLKKEIIKNIHLFIEWEKARGNIMIQNGINKALNMFRINLLVDNSNTKGAPLVYEKVPTLKGLFGQINYRAEMGILYADHLSLTAGSLHRANGGFLVVDLWELLKNPYLWIIFKRALLHKKLYLMGGMIEEIPVPHVGLSPEPIPFQTKVFLIGDPYLYYLLSLYDEEFKKLFKIKAEFDPLLPLDEVTINSFPKIVKKIIQEEKLKDLSTSALNELFKNAIVEANNKRKIKLVIEDIKDILREANAFSLNENIEREDIIRAIKEKKYRVNLIEEKIMEYIKDKKYIISVEGTKIGQINGLSVINLGDYSFGKPSRITASVYPGTKGVINIEREIELSGPIHSKGVLTLTSYIFHKYSSHFPLQLSCTLTFEQGYEFVEGDSASCAELLAILSAISKIPIRQDLALTGSIDQFGNLQPVGGIKEKIEGFFKVCKLLNFTGSQGVIIPYQNRDNLTLDEEVIEEIKKGNFHLYTAETIDDIIEIYTGLKPEKFHKKVFDNLKNFYELSKEEKPKKRSNRKKK